MRNCKRVSALSGQVFQIKQLMDATILRKTKLVESYETAMELLEVMTDDISDDLDELFAAYSQHEVELNRRVVDMHLYRAEHLCAKRARQREVSAILSRPLPGPAMDLRKSTPSSDSSPLQFSRFIPCTESNSKNGDQQERDGSRSRDVSEVHRQTQVCRRRDDSGVPDALSRPRVERVSLRSADVFGLNRSTTFDSPNESARFHGNDRNSVQRDTTEHGYKSSRYRAFRSDGAVGSRCEQQSSTL